MSYDTSKMQTKNMSISLENILPSLAKNLYGDDWRISIRELLQNAHDALQERRAWPPRESARINVIPDSASGTLTFEDNGIGMTVEEVEKYLATVGYGRKREQIEKMKKEALQDRAALQNIIGQYGIGFLSSFIIAESVEVFTKSALDAKATGVRALFTGATKWYHEEATIASPGTRVVLKLRKDQVIDPVTGATLSLQELLNFQKLSDEIRRFGDLLPFPVFVHRGPNDTQPLSGNVTTGPWENPNCQTQHLIDFMKIRRPNDNAPLIAEPFRLEAARDGVTAHGMIYFPNPPEQMRQSFETVARVDLFSRRMFISDDIIALLPEWGNFVGVVVECPDLLPTLNRNDVVRHDTSFIKLRQGLSRQIIELITYIAQQRPQDFYKLFNAHTKRLYTALMENYQKTKLGSEEFFRSIVQFVPFLVIDKTRPGGKPMTLPAYITAFGNMTKGDSKPSIYYLGDPQSMAQYRAMIIQKDIPVVLAMQEIEPLLLKAYGQAFHDEVTVVDVRTILDIYVETVNQAPYELMKQFLKELDGGGPDDVTVAKFMPASVPAIMMVGVVDTAEQKRVLEGILHSSSVLEPKVRRVMEEAIRAANEGRTSVNVILNADNVIIEKIRNNCVSGRSISGVVANVLHEIYHNARAIIDPTSAADPHYFEHRNMLLSEYLDLDQKHADVSRKHDLLKVQLDAKQKEELSRVQNLPVVPQERICALLLTDLRGSSRMVGFLDREEGAEILRGYSDLIKQLVEQHGGKVEKFTGDGLFAYFWSPDVSHEKLVQNASDCAFKVLGETTRYFSQSDIKNRLLLAGGINVHGCRTVLHIGAVHYGLFAGVPTLIGKNVVALFRALEKKELFEQYPIILTEPFLTELKAAPHPQVLKANVKLDDNLPSMTFFPHPGLIGQKLG